MIKYVYKGKVYLIKRVNKNYLRKLRKSYKDRKLPHYMALLKLIVSPHIEINDFTGKVKELYKFIDKMEDFIIYGKHD